MRVLIAILLLLVSLLACIHGRASFTVRPIPLQRIPAPAGAYRDVTWLSDERFVVSYEAHLDSQEWSRHLWRLRSDGSNMKAMDLPQDRQRCERTEYRNPQALQDGRLLFMRVCQPQQTWWQSVPYVMVWNPHSDTSHSVRDYELPSHIATFTFGPDLSRGLLATATGIEDELYWLDEDTARAMELEWARASRPAWSPDGASIVFFGSQELRGRPGPHWVDQPDDLWLMPAECESRAVGCAGSVEVILHNVVYPGRLSWSSDSEWIVFDGNLDGNKRGVWLRHMESGELYQIAQGDYQVPAWSPDGQQIVVIGPPKGADAIDAFDNRSALYTLDVREIVIP